MANMPAHIFLVNMVLARDIPAQASRGKATALHSMDMKAHGDATMLSAPSKLRGARTEFSTVAHLWGAYRAMLRSEEHGEGAEIDWPLLLAISERYRFWGERHHSPAGRTGTGQLKATMLDAKKVWRTPANAALPLDEVAKVDRLRPGLRFAEMV